MATINFTYDGKEYTLGFNRRTAEALSDSGFTLDKYADDVVGYRGRLFEGSFAMNHRTTNHATVTEIWKHLPHKTDIMEALVNMYVETVNTIWAEPDEDDAKKVEWEVVK